MGQEQSYAAQTSTAPVKRYKEKYQDHFRASSVDFRPSDYQDLDYKRHKVRRSADSFKSDISSTESSGYRSGSSACECRSEISTKSDYYCTSLYKNDHYKDVNKDLYKPVKLSKEKRYKQVSETEEELKSARLQNYLSDAEKSKSKVSSTQKKSGIRNYTPKILEEEQKKKVEDWI